MPSDVLKAVIKFYTLDAEINQFLETLMTPAFVDRPVEQKITILDVYGELFERCGGAGAQGGAGTAAAGLGLLALVVGGPAALPACRRAGRLEPSLSVEARRSAA